MKHGAGGGTKIMLGILGVDSAFDGRTARSRRLRHRAARRDAQLLAHQVAAEAHLGHRMLDLQARIHFEEVKVVALDQELRGAGVGVVRRAREFQRRVDHLRAHRVGKSGRRRFLDNLLMAPLDRAIALAECDHVAMIVAENLNFDMPRVREILFDENPAVAESRRRFARSRFQSGFELNGFRNHAHPAPTAAGGGLDQDRIANGRAKFARR